MRIFAHQSCPTLPKSLPVGSLVILKDSVHILVTTHSSLCIWGTDSEGMSILPNQVPKPARAAFKVLDEQKFDTILRLTYYLSRNPEWREATLGTTTGNPFPISNLSTKIQGWTSPVSEVTALDL